MGRRTAQNQRKVKIPAGLKKRLKKVKAEKAVEVPAIKNEETSCCSQATSCCD